MDATIPESRRPVPVRSRVLSLLTVSAALQVLLSTANVGFLAQATGIARGRDLALPWLLRRSLETAEINLLRWMPEVMSRPFRLDEPGETALFLALAVLVGMVLAFALCLVLLPAVAVAARLLPRDRDSAAARWIWEVVFPATLVTAWSAPLLLVVVRHLHYDGHARIVFGILVAVWALGLAFFSSAGLRRIEPALRWIGGAGSALAILGAVIGLLSSLNASEAARAAAPSGAPNILLVSIDSLRRDHLSCYGYRFETSPRIDQLASEGTRFETVAAPTTWTLPSHLTLLTGLAPERHGVVMHDLRLAPDVVSVAQVLQRAGYATAGFVGAPYLDAGFGFARGFDHYDDYSVARSTTVHAHEHITSPDLHRITTDWLREWDRSGRERPFFVFLHLWDVHLDYNPPPPYDTMFPPDMERAETIAARREIPMSVEALAQWMADYNGEIRFTDEYLGRVFDLLMEMGVYEETVIAVTSDHGDEFFEHGTDGHRKNLYDETLLVPLVFRYPPRVPADWVIPQQVRLMDIAPTLLSLAGVEPAAGFGTQEPRGPHAERDLSPYFAADSSGFSLPPLHAFGDLNGVLGALRTQEDKLHWHLREAPPGMPDKEMYDLVADPGEQINVYGENLRRDVEREKALEAWRSAMHAGASLVEGSLSDEQRELLRSLGYIN